ncbi:MAG: T9SS type A sorting domain-containing protein [Flavobacteriales bacterium]|nr:T9SS type A sorting domain-containing protein [Flavobacteriales bacterium]
MNQKHLPMRYVLLIFVLCYSLTSFGQSLVTGEYFFDIDEGPGTGTPISITGEGSMFDNINVDQLTVGPHILCSRCMNNASLWSGARCIPIVVSPPVDAGSTFITTTEYFFDEDNGPGTGTPVIVVNGPVTDVLQAVSTSGLTAGPHLLCYRALNNNGLWGGSRCMNLYAIQQENSNQIVACEYFFNNDGGPGSGLPIAITPSGLINIDEIVAVSSLSAGINKLCLRFQTADGLWSGSRCLNIFVEPNQEGITVIEEAEYFLDNDPNPGEGISIDISADITTSITESINAATYSQGLHKLCYRIKNSQGVWSGSKCMDVYVGQAQNEFMTEIVAAEYFIGEDPGQGNGTSVALDASSIAQINEEITLLGLPEGDYTISVRFMNQYGDWSGVQSENFVICGFGPPIASFDYNLDTFNVIFENTSQYASGSSWDFGTSQSTETNPVLSVTGPGVYEVCLAVSNNCGDDDICEYVIVPDTLQITEVIPGEVIPGETFDVSFTANYVNFIAGNTFTLQLNGPDGTFSNPIELTTMVSSTGGIFNDVLLPINLPPNCYRLRVVSSTPTFASNEASLKVNNLTSANPANYALRFDGIDDYVNFGPLLGDHDFTVSFWVKPDSTQVSDPVIADMQNDFVLYENPNVEYNYVLSHLAQFDMLPGHWNQVTITMDHLTNQRKIYLFGQLVDQNTWNYNPQINYEFLFGHGNSFSNAWFKGYMDELIIWDYNMDAQEVFASAHSTITGSEIGALAYFNFDDGCTQEALDLSPYGHQASLHGNIQHVVSDIPSFSNFVTPNHGGNNGYVTLQIAGEFYEGSPTVTLTSSLFPAIVADTSYYNSTYDLVTARFNLVGTNIGLYDVEVLTSDSTSVKYTQSFTIEESIAGHVEISILGRNTIRAGGVHTFFIVYENTSNNDIHSPVTLLESYADDYIGFVDQDLEYQFHHLPIILGNLNYDLSVQAYQADSIISPGIQYVIPIRSKTGIGGSRDNCQDVSGYTLQLLMVRNPENPFDNITPDGCSNPEWAVGGINNFLSWNNLENIDIDWNNEFSGPCNRHDTCYQMCYTFFSQPQAKTICDLQFLQQLIGHCSSDELSDGIEVSVCKQAAILYFLGVHTFGSPFFNWSQAGCTITHLLPDFSPEENIEYVPDCGVCPPDAICFTTNRISSYDPNEKVGPSRYQNLDDTFEYAIYYENADSATAAAQRVLVIDTLNPAYFDFSTFQFLGFGFDDELKFIPQDQPQQFTVDTDLRPEKNLLLRTNGFFDPTTGIATWDFTSLDPQTMQLTEEVELGFLDPNDSTGRGQGFVYFKVNPQPGLQTGDSITNHASIYFDYNPPIVTEDWLNTIDLVAPWSNVLPLDEVQADSTFLITWTGADSLISTIDHYSIYVSENGGPYTVWQEIVYDTAVYYTGHNGSSYAFYSIAIDNAGNVEGEPEMPDATTLINVVYIPPVFNLTIDQNECSYSEAFVSVSASSGNPPFIFTWDDNIMNDTLYNASAGDHHLIVTDVNAEIVLDTVIQVSYPLPLLYEASITPVNCPGGQDGSAVVMATGGTGAFFFDWQGEDPSQLSAGIHPFTISDENGCQTDGMVNITEPEPIVVNAEIVPAIAELNCDGAITLSVTGGSPPYDIIWNTTQTGETIVDLCPGEYTASITDDHGCTNEENFWTVPLGELEITQSIPELIVSPNPSNGRFHIMLKNGDSYIIWTVYDAAGNTVMSKRETPASLMRYEWSFDLTTHAEGSYLIEIKTERKTYQRKLIVTKD